MKISQVKEIANAILYEGYLLYPYRHSAIKNRQRWTFGVVYPHAYSEANGGIDPCTMQTACLFTGSAESILDISVRFLHLLLRSEQRDEPVPSSNTTMSHWTPDAWEEGIEREISIADITLDELLIQPRSVEISFPGNRIITPMEEKPSKAIMREQRPLSGAICLVAEQMERDLYQIRVQIENTSDRTGQDMSRRDAILLQSFISTHTILQVRRGTFLSLLDPPMEQQALAQTCQNVRTWPVLVGNPGEHDTLLSSPIILYDYPQIAPESAGPLFDGTEIDELLTLRILTLTDEEKEAMRQGDERTRAMLERSESLTPQQFMHLHGTIRNWRTLPEGEDR
jgi:hydrogenase maturation protease